MVRLELLVELTWNDPVTLMYHQLKSVNLFCVVLCNRDDVCSVQLKHKLPEY